MDKMKEALERRRGRGLDIQLMIGDSEPITATFPIEKVQEAIAGAGEVEAVEDASDLADNAGLAPEITATVGEGEVEGEEEDGEELAMLKKSMGRHSLLNRK